MEQKMTYILDFRDVDKGSLPLVGGKNASLGEMIKAGIRVPPDLPSPRKAISTS
jgi:pyruvate,water dikinase